MSDLETLAERLAAVERAVTDGETDLVGLDDAADLAGRIEALDDRLGTMEERVADLEAATQALRGYVGNVRAVNDEVERRADVALARVKTVERILEDEGVREPSRPGTRPPVAPETGEGWRDATGTASPGPGTGEGGDAAASGGPCADGTPPADERDGSADRTDGFDETDRHDDDLRAVVDRLREAL